MAKKWETPQLVVLVRREPDEVVLSGCKTGRRSIGTRAPTGHYGSCTHWDGEGACSDCRDVGS
jgi:hypothetical protein